MWGRSCGPRPRTTPLRLRSAPWIRPRAWKVSASAAPAARAVVISLSVSGPTSVVTGVSPRSLSGESSLAGERITVRGLVQGVGFRPFVFRIAAACGVRGSVRNTGAGVEIDAFGTGPELALFLSFFPHIDEPADFGLLAHQRLSIRALLDAHAA